MWRCICGYTHRNISIACSECGRTISDLAPFIGRLKRIELAVELTHQNRSEVAEFEKVALESLAIDLPLCDIAQELENIGKPLARRLAEILRNLDDSEAISEN